MNLWFLFVLNIFLLVVVNSAVVPEDDDVEQQGLYNKSDHIQILTDHNFERKVYGQNHALLVQFYNSYCGHCRAFAPKFKALASEITHWKNIIKLAVIDCSVEENSGICRQFEIMAYPSLRYIHEQFVKSNSNVGVKINIGESTEKLKTSIIAKLQNEQSMGRLTFAPSFNIESHATYTEALRDVPKNVMYTFLVFENINSTVGSELILDVSDYENVRIKRVYENSELADIAHVQQIPGVVVIESNLKTKKLTPKELTKQSILQAINSFLKSKSYVFPTNDVQEIIFEERSNEDTFSPLSDVVYYNDLEKTLKTIFHTEITRYKTLSGEQLKALLDYLDSLISFFPFRGNLKEFVTGFHVTLLTKSSWSGSEIYDLIKTLESTYKPVYVTDLEYAGCKGSEPHYRGYTCGLWTLFHTLTVNAAQKTGAGGPKVLAAMHGFIKNFFGCTECSQHFQEMAARNRIFDVKENDKAVLWLWISHNEVNLRIAGDVTEDPKHPKIQFPSVFKCPGCRLVRGAWNLSAVYRYLQSMYGVDNIKERKSYLSAVTPSPFSNMDIGMLSFLNRYT